MKRWVFIPLLCLCLGLTGLGLAGCGNQTSNGSAAGAGAGSGSATATAPAAGSEAPLGAPGMPTQAQPRLQTMKLHVGARDLTAELALTPKEEMTGMMFRTNVVEGEGMLFVMPEPQQASFWMTNCFIPLSAAYIDADGIIVELHEFKAHDATPVQSQSNNIQYVLETKQGWFERNQISVGTAISTERGPLRKVFFGNP